MADVEDDRAILERVELSDSEDEDFDYGGVEEDVSEEDEDEDEDLSAALATLQNIRGGRNDGKTTLKGHIQGNGGEGGGTDDGAAKQGTVITQVRPSIVDDFIRNFLIKVGMTRTLDSFNTEWYELQAKGRLSEEYTTKVPDIYLRNQELDEQVIGLRQELLKMQEIAGRAQSTWDKFRKERDFHRMHHQRVVQEKAKLVGDLKRLKKSFKAYEPTLNELERKYQAAIKEKMLMKLERDRVRARMEALEGQMKQMQVNNPFLDLMFQSPPVERFALRKSFKGHLNSVSAMAFHPRKAIVATVSDDETWKIWSVPNCDLVMSGEGHRNWIAGVDFHPLGIMLATGSGDNTVKLWDFSQASCTATFTDHTQAVWGVAFHHTGDFFASCSMDHTARLWDVSSQRCRQTFRGHVDSVNSICWQPYTNNICTGSGDKTVSVWDTRSGLCMQTFYGHTNAVNHVCSTLKGDMVASCDADGVVKLWDVRMVAEVGTMEAGQHPLNAVCFDRSATRLTAASDDGTVKVFDTVSKTLCSEMKGHEDAVQCTLFSPADDYLISSSSDCTFRIWS